MSDFAWIMLGFMVMAVVMGITGNNKAAMCLEAAKAHIELKECK